MAVDPAASRAAATHPSLVSRAYGVRQTAVVGKIAPAPKAAPAAGADTIATSSRLVAAVVPGKVDFNAAEPAQKNTGVYSMHRRPADRSEAATAIQLGRTLDLNG